MKGQKQLLSLHQPLWYEFSTYILLNIIDCIKKIMVSQQPSDGLAVSLTDTLTFKLQAIVFSTSKFIIQDNLILQIIMKQLFSSNHKHMQFERSEPGNMFNQS